MRKATANFVVEPNNSNTWSKVNSMIVSFLFKPWRDGALVGEKPGNAFYVKVGLNETMTPRDILDGYMNVEIGLAIMRQREFIILRFSQVMGRS